jgi:hypothetical protein
MVRQLRSFDSFRARAEHVVNSHPVAVHNGYTKWFARGEATGDEVRHLTVQFSVFSHQFVEAQLRKVFNAATLDQYRASKEILMNELGVVFRKEHGPSPGVPQERSSSAGLEEIGTEGTVNGSRYRHEAAHFEWLLQFGKALGIPFEEMGKRRQGTPSTLYFCDQLLAIYGSEDPSTAEGASYAVEHWAAAGFWKELIAGLRAYKYRECPELPLGFFVWHDLVEDQHAAHTDDELREAFERPGFDQEAFLRGARDMLDGVQVFWDGLMADRRPMQLAA